MLSSTEARKTGRTDFMAPKWHDSTKISGCSSRNMFCWMVKGVLTIPWKMGRASGSTSVEEGVIRWWIPTRFGKIIEIAHRVEEAQISVGNESCSKYRI